MQQGLAAKAEAYLGRVLNVDGFRVISAEPISGAGLSRLVVKLTTRCASQTAEVHYILLMQQSGSPVEPNPMAEFVTLRALAGRPEITVAAAHWIEPDPQFLGAPFLLTGLLPGLVKPQTLMEPAYLPFARDIVQDSFRTLGRLAAIDVHGLDLAAGMAAPACADVWAVQLEYWERLLRQSGCDTLGITSAALRRLRRAPPPAPDKLSIIHGDYRLGNYLFDRKGLTGVIDWEMAHLGDGLEDLAWSLMPNWEFAARPGRPGGFLSKEEAIAAWQSASGRVADPAVLAWWSIFCHVKAIAIWATARHLVASGKEEGIMMALVAWGSVEKQESHLVRLLRGAP